MSTDDEQVDDERNGKLLPDPPSQGGYGTNDWDGSRRSWTGIPEDGSWIEKVSDKPFRLRVQTPRPLHEPEPERVGYGKPPRGEALQARAVRQPQGPAARVEEQAQASAHR
jgi:hypothetical protein